MLHNNSCPQEDDQETFLNLAILTTAEDNKCISLEYRSDFLIFLLAESIIARLPKDEIYEQVSVPLLEKHFDDFVVPEMLNKSMWDARIYWMIWLIKWLMKQQIISLHFLRYQKKVTLFEHWSHQRKNDFEIIHILVNSFFLKPHILKKQIGYMFVFPKSNLLMLHKEAHLLYSFYNPTTFRIYFCILLCT